MYVEACVFGECMIFAITCVWLHHTAKNWQWMFCWSLSHRQAEEAGPRKEDRYPERQGGEPTDAEVRSRLATHEMYRILMHARLRHFAGGNNSMCVCARLVRDVGVRGTEQ